MKRKTREEKGITLIALIITIVVLLILAVVAINAVTGDGIIQHATNAKTEYEKAQDEEKDMLDTYLGKLEENLTAPIPISEAQGKVLSTIANLIVVDEFGNKIKVPAGFKITEDADNVTEGIVITDGTNEFVWIPVGNIFTNTDKTEFETIILGRYESFTTNSEDKYIPIQPTNAKTYKEEVEIVSSGYNFIESQPTVNGKDVTYGNKIAKNINDFYEKTLASGGYYIGRYEAGDSSINSNVARTGENGSSTPGTLVCKPNQPVYNWITQSDAAIKCQNMYTGKTFNSDLMNSYAWDTAIIFIQTFVKNSNYAETIGLSTDTSAPKNTGTNKLNQTNEIDKQLNIYDMAANCMEFTTETFSYADAPCVIRGGNYLWNNRATRGRGGSGVTESRVDTSFRPILYL